MFLLRIQQNDKVARANPNFLGIRERSEPSLSYWTWSESRGRISPAVEVHPTDVGVAGFGRK